jgi:putative membrane-bound dehydrogenase-like protein
MDLRTGHSSFATLVTIAALASSTLARAAEFPAIYNTEPETIPFTKPADALAGIQLPDGFQATLFAAEPNVQQPIGIATDARGRLWIAENYTYSERAVNFDTKLRDRIVILEDANGDGQFDKRTVFWDQAVELTSVLPSFGGAYALCPPKLLFIPDANGDDIPDGEPQVVLDGFDPTAVRHNIANGLKFGPDGWIYGRHGILATSKVGVPGTPAEQRVPVNACVWRFHPVTKKVEVVASGTTNPWGDDWDEYGEHFLINTVIGHLWHVIPGAWYRRMYGEHPNPYLYELIEQTADHFHWDTKEVWSDVRKLGVTSTSNERGGGHAHSGLMVYLGDNWPDRFRNTALTINYHGRRLNNDRLERDGATYTGRHNPDLMFVSDPWFRGIDLVYGPDGGVYVTDWSDIGECHDDSGIHRSSGRIYKVTYGQPKPWTGDLNRLSNEELAALQAHPNEWFARHSREVLHYRAAQGQDLKAAHAALRKIFATNADDKIKLRALLTLYVTGDMDEAAAQRLLAHSNEHLAAWAIRFLTDQAAPSASTAEAFAKLARETKSGLVLTYLASALQRVSPEQALAIASGLAAHGEFANDRVFPLMVWYGLEPLAPKHPAQAVALAGESQLPKVRRYIARRLFENLAANSGPADQIAQLLKSPRSADFQFDILTGINEALKGIQKPTAPASWKSVAEDLIGASDPRVRELALQLSALFGDERAIDALRSVVADDKADAPQRRRAFAMLLQLRAPNLLPAIQASLNNRDLSEEMIRALATLGDAATPEILLSRYAALPTPAAKQEAINALAGRAAFAHRLLDATQRGQIPRADISAAQLRQMRNFKEASLTEKLNELWPQLDESPSAKKQLYAKYKAQLAPEQIAKADPAKGRELFQTACANCHTLYGEGAKLGPDLTGSDRRNLDYLLDNLLNPSAVVPETYRVSTLNLKDGRSLTAIVLSQTPTALTAQAVNEKLTLPKSEIESIQPSQLSMMPDGLLDALSETQTLDLFSYLMSQSPGK